MNNDPNRVLREWREFAEFCDAEDRRQAWKRRGLWTLAVIALAALWGM